MRARIGILLSPAVSAGVAREEPARLRLDFILRVPIDRAAVQRDEFMYVVVPAHPPVVPFKEGLDFAVVRHPRVPVRQLAPLKGGEAVDGALRIGTL
ncbi:hypothetical protein GCM10010228_77150 [Streptomyces massasporeus]|nr:hypothetical protein GCM10010228_77150 [Streptomyces massasporeus]